MEALNEQTAVDYVRDLEMASAFFGDLTSLSSKAITEGNINLIFRISDGARSLLVKQALPYSWRYPEFMLPVERADLEHEMLQLEARYCPEQTLKVYFFDQPNHIQVVEDLNRHVVMREGLMQRIKYPLAAQHVGSFAARTLFYTSDLFLPSAEKKAMQPRFMNPVMRKLQEDLCFTQPYLPHPNNRWTQLNDAQVQAVYADDALRAEMFVLKERYMTHAQALIHNDLHTGSIMLNQTETKVIDPEFAFFGPMGHDVGSYLANLVLSYASQEHYSLTEVERKAYRAWILESLRETWLVFEREFLAAWEVDGLKDEWPSPTFKRQYLQRLLQDAAGFGAAEIYRRAIGLAHVVDLDSIPDDATRARAENLACGVARKWLMDRQRVTTIDDLIERVMTTVPTI
jgi:5-methylthioribose kinase